ncbi:MAG: hypothetical protein K9M82_03720 [Deltaproteobacteria bacterium]|nr:hypothetical protein [Deltaproteobacteria bacterium]
MRKHELDEDDLIRIGTIFEAEIVPRLRRHHARIGTLNCGFAGPAYADWTLRFRSAGGGFEITEVEYDEGGDGLDLDL